MAMGLIQYALARKNLPEDAHRVANPLPREQLPARSALIVAAAAVLIVLLVPTGVVHAENLATFMAWLASSRPCCTSW